MVLLSLRAQLRAPASSSRPVTTLSFNPDGSANASRCVSVAWLPGTDGTALVAAHRDGAVLLYHKVVGSSSEPRLLARSSSQAQLRPPATQLQAPGGGGGASAAAVSPDGQHVAVACRDGVLRVYSYPGGGLVAGFKVRPRCRLAAMRAAGCGWLMAIAQLAAVLLSHHSCWLLTASYRRSPPQQSYYGGLLCCCWSPDGRYVAAGGEDDLLAVYGLQGEGVQQRRWRCATL